MGENRQPNSKNPEDYNINSFNKYLLTTQYLPVAVLSTKEIVVKNIKNTCCHRAYIITEKNNRKKQNIDR